MNKNSDIMDILKMIADKCNDDKYDLSVVQVDGSWLLVKNLRDGKEYIIEVTENIYYKHSKGVW